MGVSCWVGWGVSRDLRMSGWKRRPSAPFVVLFGEDGSDQADGLAVGEVPAGRCVGGFRGERSLVVGPDLGPYPVGKRREGETSAWLDRVVTHGGLSFT